MRLAEISAELFAMNAQLSRFNAAILPHFSMPKQRKEHLTKHTCEANIEGHLVDLEYQTRHDFLDNQTEIVWQSVRVLHDGEEITNWLKPNILSNLHREVESHFEHRDEDKDYQ